MRNATMSFGRREPKGFGGAEQRRARRTPVEWRASIVLDDGSAHPCLIRDISDTGARLEVTSVIGIPPRFILRATSGQRPVAVVRRGIRQLGVKFIRD
jgi:hypothetical protein